jgi:hypothetical protein
VLRYYNRRPITYRRYGGLWARIGHHLPRAATQGVTATFIEADLSEVAVAALTGEPHPLAEHDE